MLMDAEATHGLEPAIAAIGRELVAAMPAARHTPRAALERRIMGAMVDDAELRAALFRFVDVRPACATPQDLTRHLHELLAEAEESRPRPPPSRPAARSAAVADRAAPASSRWRSASSSARTRRARCRRSPPCGAGHRDDVDLLGEATVTEAEADRYAARCEETLRGRASQAGRGARS